MPERRTLTQQATKSKGEDEWCDAKNAQALKDLRNPEIQIPKFKKLIEFKQRKLKELESIMKIMSNSPVKIAKSVNGEIAALEADIKKLKTSITRMEETGTVGHDDLVATVRTDITEALQA